MIVKASGERQAFSEAKLRRSLKRVRASREATETIVTEVKRKLKDGMTTSEIYKLAFSLLKKSHRPTASRYHLRRALMELGPTGHPFEHFIGELLKAEGYAVEVGVTVKGMCVSHEIDVSAVKEARHIMVECKYHNEPGARSDVKVSLYVEARFEDVAKRWKKEPGHGTKFHEAWLATNTKLTKDATDYAECVGMTALGWSHPKGDGLEERIERLGLHPITCLTHLSGREKQELIGRGHILCRDILVRKSALEEIGCSPEKISAIVREIKELCHM